MEKKKIGLIILAVLIVTALFTAPASAAYKWYTCTVVEAGPGGTIVNIRLTDTGGSFTNLWFRAYPGKEDRQLATALTAMTSGLQVRVYVDPTIASLGSRLINSMYLSTF